MKIIINEIPVEIDFDYDQVVYYLRGNKPVKGKINGVSVLAKPKSGSRNNRYLILFSVYSGGSEVVLPYGCISKGAEGSYNATAPKLLFVSSSGEVTERSLEDWLIPHFCKSVGEYLIELYSK